MKRFHDRLLWQRQSDSAGRDRFACGGLASVLCMSGLLAGCVASRPISTGTLLAEMTDLARLAEFPQPPFTCRQASSYDRASISPADGEKWFANSDHGKFLRTEWHGGRTEYVMMDADGPGAIVRIWSANPKGTLRIYLDRDESPVLEVPLSDLLSGKVPGIPEPIAHVRSAGWNCYFPIPYARHCKVTCDEGAFYYHVNYRTYPSDTELISFRPKDLSELSTAIEQVAAQLAGRPPAEPEPPAEAEARLRPIAREGVEVAPGTSVPFQINTSSPLAIRELCVKLEAADRNQALRQVLMTLTFDGKRTVACPLGDFFGAGPGCNPYQSLPMGITEDGRMWSRWVMPFRQSARLELYNLGSQPVRVQVRLAPVEYHWTERSMYFHAGWRSERDVPTRPMRDWNYISVQGRGVLVGAAFSLANPVRKWWGEGDEKIYVDADSFPSHFGTGTEDYYGYAWGSSQPFMHAYHNQPRCDGPGSYGRTAVNRWHILDRIPFQYRLRFDMELWHWWDGRLPEISVVTYWYARPGATSNTQPVRAADLEPAALPPYVAPRVPGALEGEEMQIVEKTGRVERQDIEGCSNDGHLWWREGQPGDRLVLSFPTAAAGQYRLLARFVKALDYGIVQLTIGDEPAGQPLDLYNKSVTVSDEIPLGVFSLQAGDNRLTAEIVGANPEAVPGYMFGLDYLRLEPARP